MTGDQSSSETKDASEASVRLDKWLWWARFFKSRSLATKKCTASKIRLNRKIVSKAHQSVSVGDVLTFPQGATIRVVKVCALGSRRGPAPEAALLYEDLAPPVVRKRKDGEALVTSVAAREPGSGRPTKADRRAMERFAKGDP